MQYVDIGDQALDLAAGFSAIQANKARKEAYLIEKRAQVDEKQKEVLTKVWANELTKNPNAKMPDELPLGVQFGAKVLAVKHNTDLTALDRQRFVAEAETYRRDLDTALASVTAENRDFYKEPVLKALSRIRDGNSDWKEEKPGVWSYTKNSDGKRYTINEPTPEFIYKYLSAHRDIEPYLKAKVAETNRLRDHNEKIVMKGGTDYYGPNDAKAVVYKGVMKDNGGFGNQINIVLPNGSLRELTNPDEIKAFNKTFKSAKDLNNLASIAESESTIQTALPLGTEKLKQARAETSLTNARLDKTKADTAKAAGDMIIVDDREIPKADAYKQIKVLSDAIFEKDPSQISVMEQALADLKAGRTRAPQSEKALQSLYEKAEDMAKAGNKRAIKFIKLLNAVTGVDEINGASTETLNWRPFDFENPVNIVEDEY